MRGRKKWMWWSRWRWNRRSWSSRKGWSQNRELCVRMETELKWN